MVDRNDKRDDGGRKRGGIIARTLTIVLAIVIAGGVGYAALHWHDLADGGKICSSEDRCVTLAPDKSLDVKTVG